jgi:hypothetical protein
MKIVNQRGQVITAEQFREKLSLLMSSAVEAANLEAKDPKRIEKEAHAKPEEMREQAKENVKKIGLDTGTKQGQAAAGAAMLTQALTAGFQEYERKTGKKVSREAMLNLEKVLTQFAVPPRGVVQDLKKIKDPWKPQQE